MRLIYNPDLLFKGIPKERQNIYYNRIFELAKEIKYDKGLTPRVINYFKIKKMTSTDHIFKFYLANDGTRCLAMYEKTDNQIFTQEPGLILLKAVSHDNQGDEGRKFDRELQSLDDFIEFDTDEDIEKNNNHNVSQDAINKYLGHHFMKTVIFDSNMDINSFLSQIVDGDNKVIYKLSEKQAETLNSEGPTFLLGCAGSGKTLVEIAQALKNAQSDISQAYFTFTPMLKDVAEDIYKKYDSIEGLKGKTYFYCLKDYLLDVTGIEERNFFSFERFKKWYTSKKFVTRYNYLKNVNLVDLWTEIRGLIKGYVGNDYFRVSTIVLNDDIIKSDDFSYLLTDNILTKVDNSNHKFYITNSSKLNSDLEFFPQIKEIISELEFKNAMIDKNTYVNKIKDSYSQYTKEQRSDIYDFVESVYQPYLKSGEDVLYDDNDLVNILINKINNNEIEKLDYVLVDELQDLSELQILAITMLTNDPNNVLMSGDVSQTINPTFFKRGRIGLIFRNRFDLKYEKLELDENFRNSEQIINVVRSLFDVRVSKLGNNKDDIVEKSLELEKKDGLPFFVDCDKKNIFSLMTTWLHIPKVAIVVASEETKEFLHNKLKIEKSIKQTNIYTVQEIKGQEFDKIIVYNILSEFKDEWKEIMSGSIDKKSDIVTKYRFYFNIFYVAITRAKHNLFLYENERNLDILKELLPHFEELTENLPQLMNLKEYDTDENRLKQAIIHFDNHDYERARTFYLQLNDKKQAYICLGYNYLHNGEYKEGIDILYAFKDHRRTAYKYTNESELLLFRVLLGLKTKTLNLQQVDKLIKNKKLSKLLNNYKDTINKDLYYKDTMIVINQLGKYRCMKKLKKMGVK